MSADPHDVILDAGEIEVSSSDDGGDASDSEAESVLSYVAPIAHSVTLNRSKRGNAGSGMALQIAKAIADDSAKATLNNEDVDEADEEFWNQDFFKDENEEDNDSFSDGDIEDEDRVDKFDSDFNDSEGEEVLEEEPEDEEEEDGKRKNVYSDPSGTKAKKRKKQMKQPIIGLKVPPKKGAPTGVNKGVSLGGFGAMTNMAGGGMSTAEMMAARAEAGIEAPPPPPDPELLRASKKGKTQAIPVNSIITTRKSKQNVLRDRSGPPSPAKKTETVSLAVKKVTPRAIKQFSQEELLTEAVHTTEPANFKWIQSRKRDMNAEQGMADAKSNMSNLASLESRFVSTSRMGIGGAGMYNTITFPSVDNVPKLLQKSVKVEDVLEEYMDGRLGGDKVGRVDVRSIKERESGGMRAGTKKKNDKEGPILCAVTGQVAKFIDPLTKLGYMDKEGFKAIRQHKSGGKKTAAVIAFENRGGGSKKVEKRAVDVVVVKSEKQ